MYKFQETEAYIEAVCQYLKENFGTIKDSWRPILNMLGTQYDLFLLAKQSVSENGLLIQGQRGMQANPSIKIENDAIIQINKLIQELGISPKQEIKLKLMENQNDGSDFLDNLTQ